MCDMYWYIKALKYSRYDATTCVSVSTFVLIVCNCLLALLTVSAYFLAMPVSTTACKLNSYSHN